MISVVIPTYNERENIGILIKGISEVLETAGAKHEIVVVDDSSPDGTAEEVRKLGKRYNCRAIVREKRGGIGSAHATGYDGAKGEIILTMDADLSHDPGDIPEFLKLISGGADIVLGSRHVPEGGYEKKSLFTMVKNLVSVSGNNIIAFLLGIGVHDYSNGYRCFKKEVWKSIDVKEKGNAFLMEFIVAAHRKGFKIVESPVYFRDRRYGESIESLRGGVKVPLLRLKALGREGTRRTKYPSSNNY